MYVGTLPLCQNGLSRAEMNPDQLEQWVIKKKVMKDIRDWPAVKEVFTAYYHGGAEAMLAILNQKYPREDNLHVVLDLEWAKRWKEKPYVE